MVGLALREAFMRSTKLTRCSFFAGSSHGRCMTSVANPETASRFKNKKSSKKADNDHDYFHNNNNDGRKEQSFDSDDPDLHDPDLHRMFFMTPDKIKSLEQAQVFISYIKDNYGPLTQYQFSRCPETKRYFGYGFLTFKEKSSLEKALADKYIRVYQKDFELKRTGVMPSRRAVIHKNPGFSGFYDLEELRAKKREQEEQEQQQRIQNEGTVGILTGSHGRDEPSKEEEATQEQSKPFVSALPSSSLSSGASIDSPSPADSSSASPNSTDTAPGATPKPFYVPLQKKGRAQIWKTITYEMDKTERSSEGEDITDDSLEVMDGSIGHTISKEI
ncbi:hypothetical protein BGX34_010103 [Mortierella sp. NVP85]|nr:hypothetical protein BGX34_010103 [Mortierella sp. NVP85]